MTPVPWFLYDGSMTTTANDTQPQQPAEAPLTWTKKKEWGSEGLTHRAAATINGESWTFTVDSPSKGQWVARAWRDGDFALYREDRTMKGAKQQAQDYADEAATSTCTECKRITHGKVSGHKLDCGTGRAEAVARSTERGERIGLRSEDAPAPVVLVDEGAELLAVTEVQDSVIIGPAVLDQLGPEDAQKLMAELEETFPHLAEWKARTLGDRLRKTGDQLGQAAETMAAQMMPAVVDASESMRRMSEAVERVQAARDRVQLRKETCGCRTPLHTMRCGVGGRARVISPAVSA
ncbi:hypothetical protein SEA_YDN12_52 [Streptomyces phage YDN12]|uniref:Uncharacterized protein n=1 Tax=Streptomyces phage YDN12 TaxID=1636183 RepID=A0A0E3GMT5_9CAUD|nr:hypothetical protein AVT63_gp51 [Streptomyces phage YDN12]AKA61719.1 hypothetical protein SEA_YDN12_52 [Streptomyces phage YDN12]